MITRFILLFCLLVPVVFGQKLSPDEREILWHQDQRLVGDSVLFRYLGDKDANIRIKAAMALGNIQDSSALGPLVPLLKDKSAKVRAAVAFALGEIGSATSEHQLGEQLRSETNPEALARLLEALGRSGSEESYDDVVAFGLPKKLAAVKADQALSIARFALRNIKSERGVWFCFDALEEAETRTRWCALYALWRIGSHSAIDIEVSKRKDFLTKLTSDRSADIRMHLVTFLSRVKTPDGWELLKLVQKNENRRGRGDWRVQVNLVRACASLAGKNEEALSSLVGYLSSGTNHVIGAALASLGSLSRDVVKKYGDLAGLKKKLEELARPSRSRGETIQGDALVVLARHFASEFKSDRLLWDKKSSALIKAKVIESLASIPSSEHLTWIMEELDNDTARIAMAAWESLPRILAPQSFRVYRKDTSVTNELGSKLFRRMKMALLREDMAITTLVGSAMSDSSVFLLMKQDGVEDRATEELMLAFGKLSPPNDIEAMQAIIKALGSTGDERVIPLLERAVLDADRNIGLSAAAALKRLTGTSYDDQVVQGSRPVFTDYDWKTLEGISKNQKAVIRTSRGNVTLQFLKNDAPFTVLSFYRLIRKKFYNGLNFHRVVPNFVVQGGDPRGDGWGGPNYAIRSEFSLENYDRGSVGVASAGKDTEGCQFFITHSPQPHLDGRYTIFAKVVSGMDVVDKIQVGDRIISVTLSTR